jgi:hypothetical protein
MPAPSKEMPDLHIVLLGYSQPLGSYRTTVALWALTCNELCVPATVVQVTWMGETSIGSAGPDDDHYTVIPKPVD